ncbi:MULTISPECIES: ABC transporter ATP-binding protein [unclassified Streptomyces]|uniref:ABC transporter ATP-binding protein n=1 Tax=unclassified Streptomyces TaxID=2593676 RepID=UPI0006AE0D0E|nr:MULTISPECIES: ATP-binding cassette domain-containing protein [unclassified Streptomyces]KOX25032.1 glycine/betaine ABC transporter [Streptomyces sp. NRRL F-6491]KOX50444.1 glycine/betaine ABC transporter [Streptomyces sp. NRRL F-6492]
MIRFEHVTKRYDDGTTAVDDLSFEVAEGELVTLVGPSGCGKTTTMMMVNRLVEPTSGRVLVDGEDIAGVDPVALRRKIGYVIQQVGLFPHRTVLDNTATVPSLLGWKKSAARARAAELLDLVGLDPATYGSRYPAQLSGGQRQRVGVARALAADPPVLLMDEPFGAVDPVVRERLQNEFLALQATVRKTVLLVTHDIEEAVRMGDRMAVYGQGRIEQFDAPATVLGSPATPYVADFVGSDRGLKRLAVTPVTEADLDPVPAGGPDGTGPGGTGPGGTGPGGEDGAPDPVPLGTSLKEALAALLQHDTGRLTVTGPDGAPLGVLTPAGVHRALRRATVPREEDVSPR